jgi:hypothetical protein
MGGGLIQLVAYGAQDVYLSGNPQITFFKVVYRRHTNFSVEPIQQTWNGIGDFSRTVTCNINRNGDLITNMYVVVKLPQRAAGATPAWGFVNRLGHAIISNIKIEIGGSKIDEHYGEWLDIWYELTHKTGQVGGYNKMIGDVPELTNITNDTVNAYQLYIPLQFWFNRNNGLALPLIALQYHDVRITLTFRDFKDCINYNGTTAPITTLSMADSYLLIDYIYLDSEERKRFAQASHEYLIEQLQFTGSETIVSLNNKLRLNFNHPSKFIVWVSHIPTFYKRSSWIAYATDYNWNAARDRFAKIIACIAAPVVSSEPLAFAPNFTTDINLLFTFPYNNDDDMFYDTNFPMSPILKKLLNKITVYFIAQDELAQVSSNMETFFNNAIVTKNELEIEDLLFTTEQLISMVPVFTGMIRGDPVTTPPLLLKGWSQSIINYHNYGLNLDGSKNPCNTAKLQLNGHDRFQERDGNYFNYIQPAQHFSNTPSDGINLYSFALKAEDHQPTGSCNFSRIDNATLNINCKNIPAGSLVNIYTQNYNVLRIMSGMAGTAYSN